MCSVSKALSRVPTSLFYFSGGVHHDARDHGSQAYTLEGREVCDGIEDEESLPEPHSGQRRFLC